MKKLIKTYFNLYKNINSLRKMLKLNNKMFKNKNVVINLVYYDISMKTTSELYIALLLAKLGAKVYLIIGDNLTHFDNKNFYRQEPEQLKYKLLKYTIIKFLQFCFNNKNISNLKYSELLKLESIPFIDQFNLNDKKYIKSSMIRYFSTEKFTFNNKEMYEYSINTNQNVRILHAVSKVLDKYYDVDLFISANGGLYSCYGPIFDYFKEKNKALTWNTDVERFGSIKLVDNLFEHCFKDTTYENKSNLYEYDRDKIEKYFVTRIKYNKEKKVCDNELKNILPSKSFLMLNKKNNNETKVFCLFPNIVFDGNIEDRNTIFNGIVEYVVSTIKMIIKTNNVLIVRYHPAEKNFSKNERLYTLVTNQVKDQYSNILHILPEQDIKSYDLIYHYCDVGIMYGGTLTYELLYLKKPVISCGKSRYFGQGFTYEMDTLKQYLDVLQSPENIIENFNLNYKIKLDKMYEFAYWYFIYNSYNIPIISKNNRTMLTNERISINEFNKSTNEFTNVIKFYIKENKNEY